MIGAPMLEIAVVAPRPAAAHARSVRRENRKAYARARRRRWPGHRRSPTFFLQAAPAPEATGFWSFYTADALAIFFKRFALVTTILVLLLMIDYAPVVRQSIHGATHQSGLGEFFALPLFTCAGLMWMASAVDFVMIFVSLELVTMSFYVLVAFTRRNPLTLEAGVKYLILSALSTGFLVYGITWIFGVTGETNLGAHHRSAARRRSSIRRPLLFGIALVLVALGFKIAAVPFQIWVPGCLPRRAHTRNRVPLRRFKSRRLRRPPPRARALPHPAASAAICLVVLAAATLIYGNLAALPQTNLKRLLAYSSIAHAGYLLIGVVALIRTRSRLLPRRLSAHDDAQLRRSHHRGAAHRRANRRLSTGCQRARPFSLFPFWWPWPRSRASLSPPDSWASSSSLTRPSANSKRCSWFSASSPSPAASITISKSCARCIGKTRSTPGAIPLSGLSRAMMVALLAGIFFLGVYPQPILNALQPKDRPSFSNTQ